MKKEHSRYIDGRTDDPLYRLYYKIKYRCENKNSPDYCYYGLRGIKCLWKTFESFREDMGESYKKHVEKHNGDTEIDRINNDGHYCKENCRWSTRKEQMQNTSRNVFATYCNKKITVSELSRITGICRKKIKQNIVNGIDPCYGKSQLSLKQLADCIGITPEGLSYRIKKFGFTEALSMKKHGDGRFKPVNYFDGKTLKEISEQTGIKYQTLWSRIYRQKLMIDEAIKDAKKRS